ncbi:hypothetical protein PPS11_43938 [Pseudomonas putida S11]|nr:hypothetical protein PPS11_43938 [Pseudomonas putida S11]
MNDLDSMMFGESAGMANSPIATTGLPRWQQPAQLEAVPVIHTLPRQGLGGNAQLGPLGGTRDREQQLRGIGGNVFAGLAQRGMFGSGMHGN